MRLLLVNDRLYPDFIGGVEKRNFDLALALVARGHEVTLAGFGEGPRELPRGVTIHSFGPLGRLYSRAGKRSRVQAFRYAWRAFGLVIDVYDVVETSNIPYVHVPSLGLKCFLARKPLLVTWHEFWGPYWRKYMSPWSAPIYRIGEWITAQCGTAVIANSALTAARLTQRRIPPAFPGDRRQVRVVPGSIDFHALRTIRAEAAVDGNAIIYAGRLIREKRVHLLVEAIAKLPRSIDARLSIFGEGPERALLEARVADLGIADRIDFFGHVEENRDLWMHIRAARVAVQPSSREGFGIFPLEAMCHGVPVIYCPSADNALSELVRDGVDGIACEPSSDALADALARLLGDEQLRQRLGSNAERRAMAFDVAEVGAVVESLLYELIGDRSASRDRGSRVTKPGDAHDASTPPKRLEH